MGESILTVISEGSHPLIVIITDSFCLGGKNPEKQYHHISTILDKEWNSPQQIDLFIWTHPHFDHSEGIDILLDKHDPQRKAHIFSPSNAANFDFHDEFKKAATSAYSYLQEKYNRHNTKQCHFIHHDPYRENYYCYKLKGNSIDSTDIDVNLEIIAPEGGLTAECVDSKNYNINDISIVYKLSINGIDIFMGGDMSAKSSTFIDDEHFRHVNLIKIPHHASNEVDNFHLKFSINECNPVHAATTVYRTGNSNDPNKGVIEGYRNLKAIVHCTGPKEDTEPTTNYGCVHYMYDLYNSLFEKLEVNGNAFEFTGSDR